ncbi:MAG: hypothetical protein ACOC91_00780 [bacterium]
MAEEKQKLLARRKRIDERLAAIEKAERRKREQDDKRRAELAGKAVLKHARKDEAFGRQLRSILAAEITGVRQRKLFDLPERTKSNQPESPPQLKAAHGTN